MGKRGGLGFQERDAFKTKKRKKEEKSCFGRRVFLEGIRDYLFSDSYMYAPLLSPAPPPHDLTVKKTPLQEKGCCPMECLRLAKSVL
ncbi:hypothetical protein EJ110_NYTH01125 [Nymphaea thermarum]|nr:hypothetical protein EJ110_NYTH01125 [Nymphaea thermarum]